MTGINLFLVASPRSGSTQLARWLETHSQISATTVKEPNFFSAHEFPEHYVRQTFLNDVEPTTYLAGLKRRPAQFAVFRTQAQYDQLSADLDSPWRMEASTSYLACPEAPLRIRQYNPQARIILLTRDPLARALSHYRLAMRTGRTTRSLTEELAQEVAGNLPPGAQYLLRPSNHGAGLKRFCATFAPDQVLRLRFEVLTSDPERCLDQISDFLGLPRGGFDVSVSARNAGVPARFPKLNHLLFKTGLKRHLRRIAPRKAKELLRPIYFNAARNVATDETEIAALQTALAELK